MDSGLLLLSAPGRTSGIWSVQILGSVLPANKGMNEGAYGEGLFMGDSEAVPPVGTAWSFYKSPIS